jgi:hypothetical protein
MRDALNNFGDISLATADSDVKSADVLDFEAIAAAARFTRHAAGVSAPDAYIMFKAAADFESIDGMIPFLESGTAESGGDITSPKKVLIGPQIIAPQKGMVFALPIPANIARYIRAGCTPKSSGSFTAKTVEAWIEFGPNVPETAPSA